MRIDDLEKLAELVAKSIQQRTEILLERMKHELSMRDQSAYGHSRRISALERAVEKLEGAGNDEAH